MKRSTLILFLLTCIFELAFGQLKQKKFTTNFYQFDLIKGNDSTLWEVQTDKIKFLKNFKPDTLQSKTALDSIVWFLKRHPFTVVEIHLKKDYVANRQYNKTIEGQKQAQQLVNYLCKKGIDPQRLVGGAIYCGPLLITDEDLKKQKSKKTNVIFTCIHVLSEDFIDPNAAGKKDH